MKSTSLHINMVMSEKVEGEIEFVEDNHSRSKQLFQKALTILQLVDNRHKTFSFERKNKITELENLIQ